LTEPIPLDNLLLAGLSTEEHNRLSRHLVVAPMGAGERLLGQEDLQDALHFIGPGLLALQPSTTAGRSTSVALIGAEGVLGLGRITSASRSSGAEATALTPLTVGTLPAEIARREFARGGAFQRNLLHFGHALTEQISRTALCSRQHPLHIQLGRWLLLARDRLPDDMIPLTHAAIARALGVRRASVSDAAIRLEHAGLIERCRGGIRIRGDTAIKRHACDCYEATRAEYEALRAVVTTSR
jgi:CRP-like cAMP-binding protein